MLRRSMTIMAIMALVAACGGGRNPALTFDAAVGFDLSTPTDLASGSADLARATGPLGCAGYVVCLTTCGSSTSCASDCMARVTPAGHALFDDGLGCGQAFCVDDTVVPARCVVDKGTNNLVDPPGRPAGTCTGCLANALAAFFGASCLPTSSPDCNPPDCTFTVSACQASTP